MMKRIENLVMFDLDGTIIDNDYKLTDDRFPEAIHRAQRAGLTIGLSSDTPYSQLDWWRSSLGMNGPIIAEKGAVVELDRQMMFDESLKREVDGSIRRTLEYLRERDGTRVIEGNATQNVKAELANDVSESTVVYLNTLSMCSLRYFVRRNKGGRAEIDDTLTQAVIDELRQFEPAIATKSVDNNPTFGLMIVGDVRIDKRYGTKKLLSQCTVGQLIMVGNSMGDYIGEDIAELYGVANTVDDYKNRSIGLGGTVTTGCIELLDRLSRERIAK